MESAGTVNMAFINYLKGTQSNPHLKHPGLEHDLLFESGYDHAGGDSCAQCDEKRLISRPPRNTSTPIVHYGTIASGSQLMRSAKTRDTFNKEYGGRILSFEMEAAGLMNMASCLVIRGISDYADSHKRVDKAWHGYASAAAAAFAKEYINVIPTRAVEDLKRVAETLEG